MCKTSKTGSPKFKAGDVVCLKSGGPLMTISYIVDDYCQCRYFAHDELYEKTLSLDCIKSVSDTECQHVKWLFDFKF